MLGIKKKQTQNEDYLIDVNKADSGNNKTSLEKGMVSLKDLIAPSSLDRSNPEYLIVGKKYVRNFMMKGFPMQSYIGWLDSVYNFEGDMDTMIHIEPADDREALDKLTEKITQFEAQLATEREKGNIRNSTRLRDAINDLYEERMKLERNTEKLFQIQI